MTPALVVLAGGLGSRFGGAKQLTSVGPAGELLLDYAIRDAGAAGVEGMVVVTRSDLVPQLRDRLSATVVAQDRDPMAREAAAGGRTRPLGTAHAALVGLRAVHGAPAIVVNGDDLYPAEAYRLLVAHLRAAADEPALPTFRVEDTVTGPAPVSRALCEVDRSGRLTGIEEGRVSDGVWSSTSTDRRVVLAGGEPVSMNCWALPAAFAGVLEAAVATFDGGPEAELLLPDLVRADLAAGHRIAALACPGRSFGLTHPEDLDVVRRALR